MPPLMEWMYHVSHTAECLGRASGRPGVVAKCMLQRFVQRRDELRLLKTAEAAFGEDGLSGEATVKEIWANAEAYVEPWFGEVSLSAGKAIDFVEHGFSGIVNLMPFSCLPGTITTVVLRRLREEHGRIPFISLAFDGIEQAAGETRLEAFVHQARQYDEWRRSREGSSP